MLTGWASPSPCSSVSWPSGRAPTATTASSWPCSSAPCSPPLIASVLLRIRNQVYRRIAELESRDDDADGIPDVYERDAT